MTKKRYPTVVELDITEDHILNGVCGNGRNCMVGLATQTALGLGTHGYVKVDATGISITRRTDYREKAPIPRPLLEAVCVHDEIKRNPNYSEAYLLKHVKPMKVKVKFVKTTMIAPKVSQERRDQINKARRLRAASGNPDRVSYKRDRMAGTTIGPRLAGRLRRVKIDRLKAEGVAW